jgi:poly-gamma-glutamate capsule biosynthesis protein CapA/YwtB (metallophosphatase superfamily)
LIDAFLRDDLTIVNLECAPSNLGTPLHKPYTFRCDPEALPSMAAAGVDVANLANNHAMDYGFVAMLDEMQNLLDVGIHPWEPTPTSSKPPRPSSQRSTAGPSPSSGAAVSTPRPDGGWPETIGRA